MKRPRHKRDADRRLLTSLGIAAQSPAVASEAQQMIESMISTNVDALKSRFPLLELDAAELTRNALRVLRKNLAHGDMSQFIMDYDRVIENNVLKDNRWKLSVTERYDLVDMLDRMNRDLFYAVAPLFESDKRYGPYRNLP